MMETRTGSLEWNIYTCDLSWVTYRSRTALAFTWKILQIASWKGDFMRQSVFVIVQYIIFSLNVMIWSWHWVKVQCIREHWHKSYDRALKVKWAISATLCQNRHSALHQSLFRKTNIPRKTHTIVCASIVSDTVRSIKLKRSFDDISLHWFLKHSSWFCLAKRVKV